MGNSIGKNGAFFVCAACGKKSLDKYGDKAIDKSWDESCMFHAILVYDPSVVAPREGFQYEAVPEDKIKEYSTEELMENGNGLHDIN